MVYIHLYHGRKHPKEKLDDWGSDGPAFKAEMIAIDYSPVNNGIRLVGVVSVDGNDEYSEEWLRYYGGDFIYYNGVYYGAQSFHGSKPPGVRVRRFDPAKAKKPHAAPTSNVTTDIGLLKL